MKWKAALMASAAAMIISAPAFADDDPVRVGAAVYGLRAEFMQLWVNALDEHPAVQEGIAEVTVFDGEYDALVQNEQFNTMVTAEYDAIIFVPIDVDAGAEAVQTAHDAGIPVVGSNTRVNSDLLTSYVGSNDVIAGEMQAEAVLEQMGYEGNVVILEGPIGQSAQIERREGNLNVIEQHDGVEVLEMRTANWSRAEALNLMENWITAHGDNIDGVIGQNDEMALGAINAMLAAGWDVSEMPISGIDGVTDALLAVQSGEMVSILQDANAQAQGALDVALRAVLGEDYEPMSPVWEQYADEMPWNDGTDAEYNVPWTPVTADNVQDLLDMRAN